ncbi:MAG TPA: HAD family hydrolase [Paracoccus sp. (in: a-proteobacteria)]|nr:HAD family hydrolase [Paracoccus sp. (in: a-proteobacteria)]
MAERIVFDLDDTLYLERDFAISGFRAVGAAMQARHGAEGFAAHCTAEFRDGRRGDIFDRALTRFNLDRAEQVTALVAIYRDHAPEISLCPDAARWFDRHGGGFGLITDGPERMQRNKIAALGLDGRIGLVIPTGQWPAGFGKPNPRAFELAQAAAGGPCVYVADNAAKDFVTPNRMGWLTVQLLRPERIHPCTAPDPLHEARARIADLDQLDAVIAAAA